ncbi:MAG TPA: Fur family transcriptional regulator [Solirubrobacterales bacterium]|jgi:Fe2+ or Zn2+ uptake regulation protein
MATATLPDAEQDLAAALRERGLRVTPQRLFIYRALVDLDRHVSAEGVLAAVGESLPNVSLPTVYSTLDLFEEMGLVRRLGVTQGAVLYDPRPDPHNHRVCDRCGAIEDFDADLDFAPALRRARRGGFQAGRAEIVVHGLCARCAAAAR